MKDFKDILNDGFSAHAQAHQSMGVSPHVTSSAVGTIRRRKRVRAAGIGGVATVAAGALAVAGMTLPGAWDQGPSEALPGGGLNGNPEWCALDTHPSINVAALGRAGYAGRVYGNLDTMEFVAVAADGTKTVLEPRPDGRIETTFGGMWDGQSFIAHDPDHPRDEAGLVVWDVSTHGGATGFPLDDGPDLGYEWTTVVPEEIPHVLNSRMLSEIHAATLGFGSTGLSTALAGDDAVVESVVRWEDGTEEVERVLRGHVGKSLPDHSGLESIATRVTWPSGETYTITSYYDESMTFENACGPVPTDAPVVMAEPDDEHATMWGPYLRGPESALFQCLAPLPADLDGIDGVVVEARTGEQYIEDAEVEVDYGDHGWMASWQTPEFVDPGPQPLYPGWVYQSSLDVGQTDEVLGWVGFVALVWVDEHGAIIARQHSPVPIEDSPWYGYDSGANHVEVLGATWGTAQWHIGDMESHALPCDGVSVDAVADATQVLIIGWGAGADRMEWSTVTLER